MSEPNPERAFCAATQSVRHRKTPATHAPAGDAKALCAHCRILIWDVRFFAGFQGLEIEDATGFPRHSEGPCGLCARGKVGALHADAKNPRSLIPTKEGRSLAILRSSFERRKLLHEGSVTRFDSLARTVRRL